MKPIISTIALTALLAIAALPMAANAQVWQHTAQIDVPFAFHFATERFPAGAYTISMLNQSTLTLSGKHRSAFAIVEAGFSPKDIANGYVDFTKFGHHYFFAKYQPAFAAMDVRVPESQSERSIATDYAMNNEPPTTAEPGLLKRANSGTQS